MDAILDSIFDERKKTFQQVGFFRENVALNDLKEKNVLKHFV